MRFLISLCVSVLLLNNAERIDGQTSEATTLSTDPCFEYTVLDDIWRDIRGDQGNHNDDTSVEWNGWYRLYLNGESAQMSEWCVTAGGCGIGKNGLYLNGSHPQLEDGVVTHDVLGYHPGGQCDEFRSTPIQIKACAGDYYVYKLVRPDESVHSPSYCAVAFDSISNDPCSNYESLDRPWRATNESGLHICDDLFSWNGWYRLFYNGMDIRMPESCVSAHSCNSDRSLWLNGPHPQIEDGVVIREVCGAEESGCCDHIALPIRVKACPGNYYVYEFVKQPLCTSYCIDVSTISPTASITDPVTTSDVTLPTATNTEDDPCYDYTILDEHHRSPDDIYAVNNEISGYDDTRVEWHGWYRFFINGSSAQMPEWCFSSMSCGGFSSLWLGGSHPQLEDGVVSRDVHGSYYDQCSHYRSDPIQVKACPSNYYVYKLVRLNRMIPVPAYCAVVVTSPPSVDPCYSYNSLDEPWRANETSTGDYLDSICDSDVNWNGWYRLFYNGQSAQMPESCVGYGMCGTYHPMWLSVPHPQLEDGVVTRKVCGATLNDCCGYTFHPIQVKACPGNYYVYEFLRPKYCAAYCAEVTNSTTMHTTTEAIPVTETSEVTNSTTMHTTTEAIPVTETSGEEGRCSELNCTEDESCEEENGVYGCFCKDNHHRSQREFDFYEICESSSGFMSLSRCQLFEAGFPPDILHLNDPSCRGTVRNGRVEFYFDNNDHICGTSLTANGTHFIYDNFILGDSGSEGIISRVKNLRINFSCVYSQTQSFSMDIIPLESIVHKILPAGQGTFQVRMIPYQDAEFSLPFTGSVNVELNKRIFVEVCVDGVDSHQLASVIDRCWATPVNDPHYSLRWDLISDMCPSPKDKVELLQSGVSTSSRFSFSMFMFTANSTKVYLHCAIHLCLLSNNHCSVHCDSEQGMREGRSVVIHDSTYISIGPLMWSQNNKGEQLPYQVQVSRAASLCASLMILLMSMMSVLISF